VKLTSKISLEFDFSSSLLL